MGHGGAGANTSYHWEWGRVHPGQVTQDSVMLLWGMFEKGQ